MTSSQSVFATFFYKKIRGIMVHFTNTAFFAEIRQFFQYKPTRNRKGRAMIWITCLKNSGQEENNPPIRENTTKKGEIPSKQRAGKYGFFLKKQEGPPRRFCTPQRSCMTRGKGFFRQLFPCHGPRLILPSPSPAPPGLYAWEEEVSSPWEEAVSPSVEGVVDPSGLVGAMSSIPVPKK